MLKHIITVRAPADADRGQWVRSLATLVDARFRYYEVDLAAETDVLLARGRREGRRQPIDALVTLWTSDRRLDLAWLDGHGEVGSTLTVSETVHWDDGVSGGVKQVAFTAPRSDLTLEEFADRYRAHAVVVREHHPGVRRYVQNFVMESADGGESAAIAELWFDDEEEYRTRFYRDETSPGVVAVDVERFLDRAGTTSVIVVEVSSQRFA